MKAFLAHIDKHVLRFEPVFPGPPAKAKWRTGPPARWRRSFRNRTLSLKLSVGIQSEAAFRQTDRTLAVGISFFALPMHKILFLNCKCFSDSWIPYKIANSLSFTQDFYGMTAWLFVVLLFVFLI
ncbi:MAG: hypothetical protein K8R53_11000 [Bacteroidales bacterium]|nr:hypothetical protein [Bacteroidales bacterium]